MKQLARCLAAALCAGLVQCSNNDGPTATSPAADAFPVAAAQVQGPITGGLHGHPMWDSWFEVASLGYVEEEYFISGRARVQPDGAEADYTTRVLITRPASAQRFNGTVLLDWVNVTAQFENPVDTLEAHDFLLRDGYAFVHVSAQAAGICCVPELTPKLWDPVRYQALNHPGDDWSFDMFAQVAKAIRAPAGTDPMGGLHVQRVLAAGQSQSASRLYDYVNQGYARSRVIDGIVIHGGGDKTFAEPVPVPVIHLLSDAEADPAEPGGDPNYALWEVGGSSHTDMYVGTHQVVGQSQRTVADLPQQPAQADADLHATAANYGEQPSPLFGACVVAGSAFPMRYAVKAALSQLDRWVRTGVRPPAAPRFSFAGAQLAQDSYGNTLGGIRYPVVDVPVARYQSTVCPLGGITVPFTDAQLAQTYGTHAAYYCATRTAADRTVAAGFLLAADRDELLARARAAANRFADDGVIDCE